MKRTIVAASLVAMASLFGRSPSTFAEEGGGAVGVRLRPVPAEQVADEGSRTLLQVQNQTPFIVFIYVEGVRIGWMRPYRTAIVRGLTTGYHKLYAHSQYGTMSWGPRDAWIPGSWNLVY